MIRKFILFSLAFVIFLNSESQIDLVSPKNPMHGNYFIGNGQDFTTLNEALISLYTNGADGAVTFLLAGSYDYTQETFPVFITDFTGASSSNTLTIKPTAGFNTPVSTSAEALFYLHNAHYVIINGSNSGEQSRDFTLINTNSSDSTGVFFIDSLSSDIEIKNCIMQACGNNAISSGVYAKEVTNLKVLNNKISKAQIGIDIQGDDTYILDNEIGGDNSQDYLDYGVYVHSGQNAVIQGNTIYKLIDDDTYSDTNAIQAIGVENLTGEVHIMNNYIDSLFFTGNNNTVRAIAIKNCNTDEFIVANNRISHIASSDYEGTRIPCGIAVSSPELSSIIIAYNSIDMPANSLYGLGNGGSYEIAVGVALDSVSGIVFKNNIISNTLGKRTDATNMAFGGAFAMSFTYNPFTEINNNVYYAGGNYDYTFVGTNPNGIMDLSQWQTFTGQDDKSISDEEVCFISDDSLQLQPCSPAIARAEYMSLLPEDIEGNQRDEDYPTIGAYTYGVVQASNVYLSGPIKGFGVVEYNKGSGYKRVVFIKQGDLQDMPEPVNGTTYNGDLNFGDGDQIGSSGWYCVYNGDSETGMFTVTGDDGLYSIMVCEYFGSEGNEIYVTDTAYLNPTTGYFGSSLINSIDKNLISIYPNPAKNFIRIKTNTNLQNSNINIYNIYGQKVLTSYIKDENNKISIKNLPSGLYFIDIQSKTKVLKSSFIIEK